MTTNQISNSEINTNSNPQSIFSFLDKDDLTSDEFGKNMQHLISISPIDESNLKQIFAIKKDVIL